MESHNDRCVNVVGMSCRFPQSNSCAEYWSTLLSHNEDCFQPLRGNNGYPREEGHSVKAGLLSQDVTSFDADFFNITPTDAILTDPQQRLLLEVVWEALEDAGINPYTLAGKKVSVYAGLWGRDYLEMGLRSGLCDNEKFFRLYSATSGAAAAAKISHFFKLKGANVFIDAACATSVTAVKLARDSLISGDCDLAIATAGNLVLQEYSHEAFMPVLSTTNQSRPFCEGSNGFVRAEGAAALVLERGMHLGKRCRGIIRGISVVFDGASVMMGSPTVEGEVQAFSDALKDANVDPDSVSFLDCQATGTVVGDPIEVEAVLQFYGREEGRKEPLYIGSAKGVIGHAESCSGMASIIKVIKCFEKERIPSQPLSGGLNHKLSSSRLKSYGIIIPTSDVVWKTGQHPRLAAVSNFGITGSMGHVILEEPPSQPTEQNHQGPDVDTFIVAVSANCEAGLAAQKKNLQTFIRQNPACHLANLSYTANACRAHHPLRSYYVTTSTKELLINLEKEKCIPRKVPVAGKLCFVYPGQNSQFPGMGKELYQNFEVFKCSLDRLDHILHSSFQMTTSIQDVMWGNSTDLLSSSLLYSQTAICVFQICITRLLDSLGVIPTFVAGHSLGEIAAAVVAGILQDEDALRIVVHRAKAIEEMVEKGGMIAVRASEEEMKCAISRFEKRYVGSWADVAAINAESQTVLSTSMKHLSLLESFLKDNGYKTHRLNSVYPMHSRTLKCIQERFPSVPPADQKEGRPIFVPSIELSLSDGNYFWEETIRPVNFLATNKRLETLGVTQYLEVSGSALLSLIRNNISQCPEINFFRSAHGTLKCVLEMIGDLYVSGQSIQWDGLYRDTAGWALVDLPFYPFQRKRYWWHGSDSIDCVVATGKGNSLTDVVKANCMTIDLQGEENAWLLDHRVEGESIFPGGGWMILIRNQLDDWAMTDYEIKSIEFIASLLLTTSEGSQKVQILLTQVHGMDDRCLKITICGKDSGRWIKFVGAQAVKCLQKDVDDYQACKDFQDIIAGTPEYMSQSDIRRELLRMGYNFGDSFQKLRSIRRDGNDFVCKVSSDIDSPIVLVDSGIQAMLLCASHCTTKLITHVPVGIRRFVCKTKKDRPLLTHTNVSDGWWHISGGSKEEALNTINARGTFYDSRGTRLFQIEGLVMAKWRSQCHSKSRKLLILQDSTEALEETAMERLPLEKLDAGFQGFGECHVGVGPQGGWLLIDDGNCTVVVDTISNELNLFGQPNSLTTTKHAAAMDVSSLAGIVVFVSAGTVPQPTTALPSQLLAIIQNVHKHKCPKFVLAIIRNEPDMAHETPDPGWSYSELIGMTKVLQAEAKSCKVKILDVTSSNILHSPRHFTHELSSNSEELHVKLTDGGSRQCHRLNEVVLETDSSSLVHPNWERYGIKFPVNSGILKDIQISPQSKPGEVPKSCVEVKVMSASITFRQLLMAMNQLDRGEGCPGDVAGIVTRVGPGTVKHKVGDAVFGISIGPVLASHYVMHEEMAIRMPNGIGFLGASTIPTSFATVYHSCVTVGKLKAGERVLIHTASGGVGIAAVRLAQELGATIFATAGTKQKRRYLRHVLGIPHVYNSRSTDCAQAILDDTSGVGVDLVLNTLTQPGFKEATLSATAANGRFIELSKINIWSREEVVALRQDVKYFTVDLSKIQRRSDFSDEMDVLEEYALSGKLLPIPYESHNIKDVQGAFQRFSRAHHIGRIVVEYSRHGNLFHDGVTYVIVGGRGGVGKEVVRWMAAHGAKQLATIGRSGVPKNESFYKDDNTGCVVRSYSADVSDFMECKDVLSRILQDSGAGYIGGVIHAAGVLHDGAIPNHSPETMDLTWGPKAKAAWNLHQLTLTSPLEHFIMFSSFTTTFGNPGQINYVAANGYLDSLSEYRRSMGLPSQSIAWGHWFEVGMAAGKKFSMLSGFTNKEGIHALEACYWEKFSLPPVVAITAPPLSGLTKIHPWLGAYVRNVNGGSDEGKFSEKIDLRQIAAETGLQLKSETDYQKRLEAVGAYVSAIVTSVVGKSFEDDQILPLDSLMKVEVDNYLSCLQLGITPTGIKGRQLSNFTSIRVISEQCLGNTGKSDVQT